MWKNICLGASALLMPGGVFFAFDGNRKNDGDDSEDFSDDKAFALFAKRCGLTLKSHQIKERGVICLVVLHKQVPEKLCATETAKDLAQGDLVEVYGLVGKKEHNGCTGILGEFSEEKQRWSVNVNTGVMAKRRVVGMLIKPDNLKQMMPNIRVDEAADELAEDHADTQVEEGIGQTPEEQ